MYGSNFGSLLLCFAAQPVAVAHHGYCFFAGTDKDASAPQGQESPQAPFRAL